MIVAPHPRTAKETAIAAAGVFVTPYVSSYLAHILESFGALDRYEDFACRFGRQFYGLEQPKTLNILTLERQPFDIPAELHYKNDQGESASVVPFLAGKKLNYTTKFD